MKRSSIYDSVSSITLLGAATCNLSCSYCFHGGGCSNNTFKSLDTEICQGLSDGTYIANVVETLDAVGACADNIIDITITGGEPFVHPQLLSKSVSDIIEKFKSLERINFVTNFSCIGGLLNTIKQIALVTNKPIGIHLMCSTDGPDGSLLQKNGHNVSWKIIENNLQKLVELFKKDIPQIVKERNISFQPIRAFKILFHGTVDKDTFIEYFSKEENILKYLEFIEEEHHRISEILSIKPFLFSFTLPMIAGPHQCTAQDGDSIAKIFALWDRLKLRYFFNNNVCVGDVLCPSYKAFASKGYTEMSDLVSGCSCPLHGPTILPDGSMVQCVPLLSTFVQNKYNSRFVHKELEDFQQSWQDVEWVSWAKYKSSLLKLNLIYGLIDELSIAGQIPFKYFGNYGLKRNAVAALFQWAHCTKVDMDETGSIYLAAPGKIRMFLNGVYDYINASVSDSRNEVLTKFPDLIVLDGAIWRQKKWYDE